MHNFLFHQRFWYNSMFMCFASIIFLHIKLSSLVYLHSLSVNLDWSKSESFLFATWVFSLGLLWIPIVKYYVSFFGAHTSITLYLTWIGLIDKLDSEDESCIAHNGKPRIRVTCLRCLISSIFGPGSVWDICHSRECGKVPTISRILSANFSLWLWFPRGTQWGCISVPWKQGESFKKNPINLSQKTKNSPFMLGENRSIDVHIHIISFTLNNSWAFLSQNFFASLTSKKSNI